MCDYTGPFHDYNCEECQDAVLRDARPGVCPGCDADYVPRPADHMYQAGPSVCPACWNRKVAACA